MYTVISKMLFKTPPPCENYCFIWLPDLHHGGSGLPWSGTRVEEEEPKTATWCSRRLLAVFGCLTGVFGKQRDCLLISTLAQTCVIQSGS